MKPRTTFALFLAAGAPARAQELFQVHYSWQEVQAGTINPAPGPLAGNSVVDPGEGARIRLGVTAHINGSSAVGQTTTYNSPPPGGVGTVRGIGSAVYDLVGDGNSTTANGSWGGAAGTMSGPGAPFNSGLSAGTPQPGGASVHGMGGAQFLVPGQSVNGANNNQQIFRGVWTPTSYADRTVHFLARASVLVPSGEQNSILFAYGYGTITNYAGFPQNYDLLASNYLLTDFGNGLHIPIAPAPASLALVVSAFFPRRARR
jgi:hypothetical protein